MEETPEEETARLVKPYRDAVLIKSDEVISALLQGRHADAAKLMEERAIAVFAWETAKGICDAYDAGNVTIIDTPDENAAGL